MPGDGGPQAARVRGERGGPDDGGDGRHALPALPLHSHPALHPGVSRVEHRAVCMCNEMEYYAFLSENTTICYALCTNPGSNLLYLLFCLFLCVQS